MRYYTASVSLGRSGGCSSTAAALGFSRPQPPSALVSCGFRSRLQDEFRELCGEQDQQAGLPVRNAGPLSLLRLSQRSGDLQMPLACSRAKCLRSSPVLSTRPVPGRRCQDAGAAAGQWRRLRLESGGSISFGMSFYIMLKIRGVAYLPASRIFSRTACTTATEFQASLSILTADLKP